MASLITGFVFGFNDNQQVFVFSNWIFNYLKFVLLSFISLGLYYLVQFHLSRNYGANLDNNIWGIERYGFERTMHLPKRFFGIEIKKISLGIILPLLVSFLSDGGLYFAAVLSSTIIVNPLYRLGRSFKKLSEFEEAKIAVSGPLINIFFAILIKIFEINQLKEMIFVCSVISISYMFPLPGLDGIKIYFGSKLLYIFSLIFILSSAFLLNFISGVSALIISVIFALICLINYFYNRN